MSTSNFDNAKAPSKKDKAEQEDVEREMYFVLSDICDDTSDYYDYGTITQNSESSFNIFISQNGNIQSSGDGKNDSAIDKVHIALDVIGFIPCFGAIPDIANGIIYLCQGDYTQMALSFVSAIPGYGDTLAAVSKGAKFVGRATKNTNVTKISSATAKRILNPDVKEYASRVVKKIQQQQVKKISVVWTNGTKYNAKLFVRGIKQLDPSIEIKSLETHIMGIQMEKIVNRKLVDEYIRDGMSKAIKEAEKKGVKLSIDDLYTFREVLKFEAFDLLKEDRLYDKVIVQGGKKELGESIYRIQEQTSKIFAGEEGSAEYFIHSIKSSDFFKRSGITKAAKEHYLSAVEKYVNENPTGIVNDYKIRFMKKGGTFGAITKEEQKIHGEVQETVLFKNRNIFNKFRHNSNDGKGIGSTGLYTINTIGK